MFQSKENYHPNKIIAKANIHYNKEILAFIIIQTQASVLSRTNKP